MEVLNHSSTDSVVDAVMRVPGMVTDPVPLNCAASSSPTPKTPVVASVALLYVPALLVTATLLAAVVPDASSSRQYAEGASLVTAPR